jgi:hypothetical protein
LSAPPDRGLAVAGSRSGRRAPAEDAPARQPPPQQGAFRPPHGREALAGDPAALPSPARATAAARAFAAGNGYLAGLIVDRLA